MSPLGISTFEEVGGYWVNFFNSKFEILAKTNVSQVNSQEVLPMNELFCKTVITILKLLK